MSSPLHLGWSLSSPQERSFHIQARPPADLPHIQGAVPLLAIQGRERAILALARRKLASKHGGFWEQFWEIRAAYQLRLTGLLEKGRLSPGKLTFLRSDGTTGILPPDSFLACSCTPNRAARHLCHRSWAAPFLQHAGWNVRVDGVLSDALQDHPAEVPDPPREWACHLADLRDRGFQVEDVRLSAFVPGQSGWRIGAVLRRGGREVGRVWGESQMLPAACSKALRALRVWASEQTIGGGEQQ